MRADDEGASDGGALSFAAGEGVRAARREGCREADGFEGGEEFNLTLGGGEMGCVRSEAFGDDVGEGEAGGEAAEGVLKDDLHGGGGLAAGELGDVFTVQLDGALVFYEVQEGEGDGGFAGARGADQAECFAGAEIEIDVFENLPAAGF